MKFLQFTDIAHVILSTNLFPTLRRQGSARRLSLLIPSEKFKPWVQQIKTLNLYSFSPLVFSVSLHLQYSRRSVREHMNKYTHFILRQHDLIETRRDESWDCKRSHLLRILLINEIPFYTSCSCRCHTTRQFGV